MGPIQSSINALTGTAWGTIASVAMVSKKFGKKPKAKEPEKPKETSEVGNMGNIVKIGRVKRNPYKSAIASANDAIQQKAFSKSFSIDERIKEAYSFTNIEKEDDK